VLADCRDASADAGIVIEQADATGGGFRSRFWPSVLANVLNILIRRFAGGQTGAAFLELREVSPSLGSRTGPASAQPFDASRPLNLSLRWWMLAPPGVQNGANHVGPAVGMPSTRPRPRHCLFGIALR
jgi:hypothetical protein